jgi:hypothetical protein
MEQRTLAADSRKRLEGFMATITNSQAADLAAQNLGDQGLAYITPALAYNDRWAQGSARRQGA